MKKTMLIVFGGLPGVGKTTLAKAVARELEAVYLFALRIPPGAGAQILKKQFEVFSVIGVLPTVVSPGAI